MNVLRYLMENSQSERSLEFNDNRISLYSGQQGKCAVTNKLLEIGYMEVHHKTPVSLGGGDDYKNLIFITSDVHKLIHATEIETINKYLNKIKVTKECLEKINNLRVLVGNNII